MDSIRLRELRPDDLATFFEHASDPASRHMAAFGSGDWSDPALFREHWEKILHKEELVGRTVLVDGKVAGYILQFVMFDKPSIGYWYGREYWGRGVASRALAEFLTLTSTRPLYARVAKDNLGSIRVLEKSGFRVVGEDRGMAVHRGVETEELILELPTR